MFALDSPTCRIFASNQNTESLRTIRLELMKPDFKMATSPTEISIPTTSMSRVSK